MASPEPIPAHTKDRGNLPQARPTTVIHTAYVRDLQNALADMGIIDAVGCRTTTSALATMSTEGRTTLACCLSAIFAEPETYPGEHFEIARGLCQHAIARADGFTHDRHRSLPTAILADLSLDEADLRCRLELGRPLQSYTDYERFKPPWGLSVTQLRRLRGPFNAALKEARIDARAQPEARLVRRRGRQAPHRPPLTLGERCGWFLRIMEDFYGRTPSYDAIEERLDAIADNAPGIHQLLGRHDRSTQLSPEQLAAECRELVLRDPVRAARYPRTTAYARALRDLAARTR